VPAANIESWGTLLEVTTGKVIAVDQDGHPALVINTLGSGKTLLSAYPIEHYLADVPAVFDKPENTHRIYQAFRDWSGVKPQFQSSDPAVEVSALDGDRRGYAIIVSHDAQPRSVTISTSLPLRSITKISAEGTTPVALDGSTWRMDIGPYEGAVVEWKQ
jgi:hypothetical protein